MESCLCSSRPHYLLGSPSSRPLNKAKHAHFPNSFSPLNTMKQASVLSMSGGGIAAKCSCPMTELEKELEGEEGSEEWMEMGNCRGDKNLVEELECLEREAIMGDDEGRDPNDYNRRAHIFDKSSRVFQALKKQSSNSTPHHQDAPT